MPAPEQAAAPAPDPDVARALALVEEACKKTAMLWLRRPGRHAADEPADPADRPVAAWHVWADGAALLVGDGIEQPLPVLDAVGDGGQVVVTVRSKDTGGRLVSWVGTARRIVPGNDTWDLAAAELHAKRLNPPDGENQPARWARESTLWRIEPTGALAESPGRMPSGSLAAEPPPSPATTRGPLPFTIGRPARRRR